MQRADLLALTATASVVPQQYVHPGLSFGQIHAIARAYWRRTLTITLAVTALTGLVSLLIPRTYTATAALMVSYEVNDPLGGREFPMGLLGSYMATQVELL